MPAWNVIVVVIFVIDIVVIVIVVIVVVIAVVFTVVVGPDMAGAAFNDDPKSLAMDSTGSKATVDRVNTAAGNEV